MKRRLALLLSGMAFAACTDAEPKKTEEHPSATVVQELPGDPLCKLPLAAATALPTQVERRFLGLAGTRTGSSLAVREPGGGASRELIVGSPGSGTTLKGYTQVLPLAQPLDIRSYTTRFEGEVAANRLGTAVAAGDFISGSGDDLVLGAPAYSSNLGIVYPVDSGLINGGDKALTTTSPRLKGFTPLEQSGTAVTVGDVTGDGVADLIVGAPFYDTSTTYTDTGAVFVQPGPVTPSSAGLLGSAPIKLLGGLTQSNYQAGSSVAVLDLNGDGSNDLVVGAPRYDAGALTDSGAVFVFFGPLSGVQSFSSANLLVFTGSVAGELAGSAVSNAGDVDKDGVADLLIGAPGSSTAAGKAYLVYGGSSLGPVATPSSLASQPRFTGVASDLAGTAIVGPGDINGDGFNDLLIGAPGHTSNTGAVYVVYGTASRFAGNSSLAATARYGGAAAASETGRALVALGDVNDDGSADFAVGAPGFSSGAGAVYVVLGYGPRWWYPDNDSDRFGTSTGAARTCGEPAAGSKKALISGDCDDTDANSYPGAAEVCDNKDNDCNGSVDDNAVDMKTWFEDADGDEYIYFSTAYLGCTPPSSSGWIDFSQFDGLECDPPAGNTDPNYSTDHDSSIHQFAAEVCDNKDNNCDGNVDEDQSLWPTWYPDGDADGYGRNASAVQACVAPANHVSNNTDCDDTLAITHPGAAEVCDSKDNNCDGAVDEGVLTTYFRDADGDGHGVPAQTAQACSKPAGYSTLSDDCNDSTTNGAQMYPGKAEVCDGLDNNCNFDTDEGVKASFFLDSDHDGYGSPYVFVSACTAPTGYVASNQDCNDASASVKPGATEVCDGKDNDCDGVVDEGVLSVWYADSDGDGVGTTNAAFSVSACSAPAGYVASHADCNDGDATVKPGGTEVCDGLDNDCDGSVDEGIATTAWYPDADGDGFGNASASPVVACRMIVSGYVGNKTDCNDSSSSINPSQAEVCEPASQTQVDNNCDGNTENGVNAKVWYRDADGDTYGDRTNTLTRCSTLPGYVERELDCNDSNPNVNPGRPEICEAGTYANQVDNDCDGDTNDVDPALPVANGGAPLWYGDADKDGHAGTGFQLRWCSDPSDLKDPLTGKVLVQGKYLLATPDDCNDSNAGAYQVLRWYKDVDRDGCGDSTDPGINSCGGPSCSVVYVTNNRDVNDANASICEL
ncbi:MopE-related protein [Hyalangium versicolor]|uniref:MopE-related protein n=1 Tax=Hyalangium versicolor TaxID=2861190 RepID=UPI001CCD44F8|nr:MopE-related protein [Hyalangium versicolor]